MTSRKCYRFFLFNTKHGLRLLFACLLCFSTLSHAAEWYETYDSGVKAVQSGNWAVAEAKLKQAKAEHPGQGKKVKAYGVYYIKYIPDYYLGVVYYNLGRFQEAITQFEIAERQGLVVSGDSEYARMTTMIQSSKDRMQGDQKEDLTSKQKMQFDTLIAQANGALAGKNYAQARDFAEKAASVGVEQQVAKDLLKKIESVEAVAVKEREAQKQFASLMTQANNALDAKQYAQARELTGKAAATGVDPQKTTELMNRIETAEGIAQKEQEKRRQFASLFDQAGRALAAKQYDRARDLAGEAAALGMEQQKIGDFLKSINAAEGSAQKEQRTAQFNTLMGQAKNALAAKEYSRARDLTAKAMATGVDQAKATEFMTSIEKLERQANVQVTTKTAQDKSQNVDQLEEEGLKAFYVGNYKEAISLLERVLQKKKDSVVAHFYLGCSNAAIGLLAEENESRNLLQKARTNFAAVRRIQPKLVPDTKFISPVILEIYKSVN